ncbi:GspS/AspS pilotin family protein [Vibrio fluvialis]|uniref:GspS/AspS pilotin family protein n=1 Tax=Vibrio fluvialis TaxID=676 RepID=UPI001C9CCE98|nr:GspS/AspS pilotin family protein [Vibrio fluvialis]MBY7923700.1 GspS/AspS pilotin family protein [Vibrio fluvialis]MBY7979312.1 GspS/AspS pilotin family protein [Vibrio fluvialis]
MKKSSLGLALLALAVLAGCSANAEREKNLELLAANRASILSSELPLEYGPLNIMRANAKGSTIELMMVYNTDHQGAKPIDQVLKNSIHSFCNNSDVRANLDVGVGYRIKMRNTRGQLMVDQMVTKEDCK